jgi:acyl-coenzyme A synthetase/AMP-(fatty) acid ligase
MHTCGGYTCQAYWTGKWIFDWRDDDIFWCVPSGNLLITNPGVKEIQDIRVGDKVLTHRGSFMPVEKIFVREYKGEIIKLLTSYSNLPVQLTPNHKVLILKKRMPLITEWVRAKDLKIGDYVTFPRIAKRREKKIIKISDILKERKVKDDYVFPKKGEKGKIKNEIKIDNNFLRLIGYYIAEGSVTRDTIQLTFSGEERELAEDNLKLFKKVFGIRARIMKYKGSWEVRADSIILAEFFSHLFGRPAYKKHLPHWILTLENDFLWEFIKGYWRGDGATDLKRRRRIRITTTSKTLAYQIKLIFNKLSIVVSLTYLPKEKVRKRQRGRKIKSVRDSYELTITGKSSQKFYSQFDLKEPKKTYSWQRAIITTNLIFFPLRKKVVSYYDGLVWNLKTAHNSYTLDNLVVHNCTADIGWITSHTYNCYANLLNSVTFLVFEGAPDWPGPDRWAQIIEKHGVTIFYTAPTAIRMFEKYGADVLKKYKFETLRLLGSVGEPIDEDAWQWYFQEVGKGRCPIVDTWWQTETGGILISSLPGLGPFRPAFAGLPLPGLKMEILDEQGKPCPAQKEGNLVILPPFAPGLLRGIYKNPEKYEQTYWSQYGNKTYFTSDAAYKDEQGLIRLAGRVDDVLKIAGHRLTTGEMENAVSKHPEITECAVVGVPDEIKGEVPVVFVVLARNEKSMEQIKNEVIEQTRKEIGPIASPKQVYVVDDLPKTRSGKIMRRVLRRLFTGEELGDLSTLANPETVEKIKNLL